MLVFNALLVLTIYCGNISMAIHEAIKYEELSQIWPLENTKRDQLQRHIGSSRKQQPKHPITHSPTALQVGRC
jgi:hypothetical protein